MYTVTELAKLVGCSRAYIKREIRLAHLKARKVGNQYQISTAAARKWLAHPGRGNRSKSKTQGE